MKYFKLNLLEKADEYFQLDYLINIRFTRKYWSENEIFKAANRGIFGDFDPLFLRWSNERLTNSKWRQRLRECKPFDLMLLINEEETPMPILKFIKQGENNDK